jgi:succinyl-diaminopimelate desuccinylase
MSADERVLARIPEVMPELVELLRELVRIPTVNPPGDNYEACAHAIGDAYRKYGHEVTYVVADDHPDHSARYPRVNVLGRLEGAAPGRCVHFNGHLDVVPAGDGWTVDPFGGVVSDGKVWGRGTADMKAGIVASLFAVEAIRRAGVKLSGAVEQSATVDEESGGFAGVAYLAEKGFLARHKQDHVIITEPLDPDRICLGHRGVYWFDVTVHGRIAHGSMPFLGESAILGMGRVLSAFERDLAPRLAARTTALPVVPDGARHATLNVNAIAGGQSIHETQTPCVADRCTAIFDRRFLDEEPLDDVRREIADLIAATGVRHDIRDRMIVHPTTTSPDAAVVGALQSSILSTYGRDAKLVASPGTYDQKHFSRLAGIVDSVAYGPGILDLAHQPDEHVTLANLEKATAVMALTVLRLLG